MRILHVSDTYWPTLGGIEVLVDHLARAQFAAGHQVRVLTRTPCRTDQIGPAGPQVVRALPLVQTGRRLQEMLDWADVVHTHLSLVSPLALRAACAAADRGIPVVASVHSMWTGGEPAMGGLGQVVGWARKPILWAPVSQAAGDSVRRALGGHVAIEVLPNAIDQDFWSPRERIDHDGVHLLAVGRMAMRKRPLTIITMLAQLRRHVPASIPLQATLVGRGPQLAHARRLVRTLGLGDWVRLPGALPPELVREEQRHSDVFIAASRLESFGLAALEARTAGLAVVGRSGTGFAQVRGLVHGDVNRDGRDDLFAIGSSGAAMVESLARLCRDPELRGRILQHNRTHRPQFGWDDLLDRAEDVYRHAQLLISGGRR